MTILDAMLPPEQGRSPMDELIDVTSQRVSMLTVDELARLAAHEYDEEAAVPAAGSKGAEFLVAVAGSYTRWLRQQGRFPTDDEAGDVCQDWLMVQPVPLVAQAYVDLALFFSHHADVARGARGEDFRRVLGQVAEELVVTLTSEYGPLV